MLYRVVDRAGRGVTEEFSHLIKPEPYYFNKKFIEIHGITPVMVKDAPSFYDLWGVIGRYFDTEALVAHNAGFDMSVLKACLERRICMPVYLNLFVLAGCPGSW